MGPGPLIAIDVILIYSILGPLVLLGIFVSFLYLETKGDVVSKRQMANHKNSDPALWIKSSFKSLFLS